jgi:hypothetical protein
MAATDSARPATSSSRFSLWGEMRDDDAGSIPPDPVTQMP